jgi:cohesin complex subunit SA-1/2
VPKVKKPRKGAKSGAAAAASSAEESEGERTVDEAEAAPRPRPKPRRVTRANAVVEEVAVDAGDEPGPVTPKARPRPRPTHRDKSPTRSLDGSENRQKSRSGSPLPAMTSPNREGEAGPSNEVVTPQSSLKRARTDDEETLDTPNGTSDPDHLLDVDGTPDLQVRRKRIRH